MAGITGKTRRETERDYPVVRVDAAQTETVLSSDDLQQGLRKRFYSQALQRSDGSSGLKRNQDGQNGGANLYGFSFHLFPVVVNAQKNSGTQSRSFRQTIRR